MNNKKIKIIVADDNKGLLYLIPKFLSKENNIEIVATTEDGEEEIKLIKELKPDIVITDLLRKKGISGLEVIKRVKEFEQNPVFIVITGSYYENELDLLEKNNNIYILRKPLNWDNFNLKIQEIIEQI